MLHLTALEDMRLDRPACLAIGAFDGVHRGHQALIGDLTAAAHASGRAAVVLTFFPHPSVVLGGRRPSFYISTPDEKAQALEALGVDVVVTHPFNAVVAAISAVDFVDRLVQYARLSELWCGADFALGRGRQGNVAFLRALGNERNFHVQVAPPLQAAGEVISSTRVRQALRDGAVEQAAHLLGRPFRLVGQVVAGAQRGRTIGIPTANLEIWEERAVPALGVYACRAFYASQVYRAVCNLGFRPTFGGGEPRPTIEAHLLDFAGDLYGAELALEFAARLRPEMKFDGVPALLSQIQQDIAAARRILGG